MEAVLTWALLSVLSVDGCRVHREERDGRACRD